MDRITVIDKQTGQKGTIGVNKFDSKRYLQIGPVQSAAYNVAQAAPGVVGTTAGILGGGAGVAATGPLGLGIGALAGGAGYAGGQALKDLIMRNFGLNTKTGEQDLELLKDTASGTGTSALTGAAGVGLAKLLPYLFTPAKKFGQIRQAAAENTNISAEKILKAIEEAQKKLSTTGTQKAGTKVASDWTRELLPLEQGPSGMLQQPAKITAQKLYNILKELEPVEKAYAKGTGAVAPQSQAATMIANELRQLPNQASNTIKYSNKILSTLKAPIATKLKYGAAGATGAGAVWSLLNYLRGNK